MITEVTNEQAKTDSALNSVSLESESISNSEQTESLLESIEEKEEIQTK